MILIILFFKKDKVVTPELAEEIKAEFGGVEADPNHKLDLPRSAEKA